jgi:hypothetical protein
MLRAQIKTHRQSYGKIIHYYNFDHNRCFISDILQSEKMKLKILYV